MEQIIPFQYATQSIRVVLDEKGNPWWIAKDVCDALGIMNPTQAVARLDDDERAMCNIGRQGETNCINEPGLYTLILGSKKPEAKQFKRWITHEVLPSLRKTGRYSMPGNQEIPKTLAPIAKEFFLALRVAKATGCSKKKAGVYANGVTRAVTGYDLYALMGIDEEDLLDPARNLTEAGTGIASGFFSALNALSPKIFSTVAEMRNGRLLIRMRPAMAAVAANGEPFTKRDLYPALKKHPAFQQSNMTHWCTASAADHRSRQAVKVWAFDLGVLSGKPVQRQESEKVVPITPKLEDEE